ncbi:LAMI_0H14752g1_1 [Lachancea mirantina]|uniref:LAMI_0H14752g1_1 n=1 Tax=Lachancea mirantina TaxID=1230905 RepID=A0A1G4KIH0_9SACH|nr:LAMI_0H14752g1_1 [Lachancea mirantina]
MVRLTEEYFDLVREAVREDQSTKRPKKRRRTRASAALKVENQTPAMIIQIDSDDNKNNVSSDEESYAIGETKHEDDDNEQFSTSNDDYASDDFEDVRFEDVQSEGNGNISLTLQPQKPERKQRSSNVVSYEEKKFRRFFHCFHLLCLLTHCYVRNEWLNDPKLHKKLAKLVPDDVFDLLHPQKDEELPLRSTRKLLDGLKKCMEIWDKHFKHRINSTNDLYMIQWFDLDGPWEQPKHFETQGRFNKAVLVGQGSNYVSAQGFVAMLRACGVNARLVFNPQPPDFTDNKPVLAEKIEEEPKDPRKERKEEDNTPILRRHKKPKKKGKIDEAIVYPIFWCEVWDKISKKWITIDPVCQKVIEQIRNRSKLEPQGKGRHNNVMRYVLGFDRKKGCRDVTRRYAAHFNGKNRKRFIRREASGEEWYTRVISYLHQRKRTKIDDYEDEYFRFKDESEGIPDNVQDLKSHPYYVLENNLKMNEALKPGCKECGFLKMKNSTSSLKVYSRKDIWTLKSARAWYNEGRTLILGARGAKTIKSKDFRTGESTEEKLYPFEQTEQFKPPPLGEDDEVPKNAYGNIDIYVPFMIPAGACLIESPVAIKAASRAGVPFAKAVTGFKFERHRIAKPQITGVVVALKYREALEAVIDGIEFSQEEEKKQDFELDVLRQWSLLLTKLRIKNRLNVAHGRVQDRDRESIWDEGEQSEEEDEDVSMHETEAGGFLPTEGSVPISEGGGFMQEAEYISRGADDAQAAEVFDEEDNDVPPQVDISTFEKTSFNAEDEPQEMTASDQKVDGNEEQVAEDYEDFMKEFGEGSDDNSDWKLDQETKSAFDDEFDYESG